MLNNKNKVKTKKWILPIGLVILILSMLWTINNIYKINHLMSKEHLLSNVRLNFGISVRKIRDAESKLRGYIMSDSHYYLNQYNMLHDEVKEKMSRLDSLLNQDDFEFNNTDDSINYYLSKHLLKLDIQLEEYKIEGEQSVSELLNDELYLSNYEAESIWLENRLNNMFLQLKETQTQLGEKNKYLYINLIIITLELIIFIFLYNYEFRKERKLLVQSTLEKANMELEAQVNERTHELIESRKELEKALEQEKKLGELKSHFVSMASHQFRTPMAIIQSNSELINMLTCNNKELDKKLTKATERIRAEITKMINLMDDLLILGKVSSGEGFSANKSTINIVNLCSSLCEEYNALQQDHRKVDFEATDKVKNIFVDPTLIHNALSNLLSNAFKYSRQSNPKLRLDCEGNWVKITISDNGIGIDKEDLKNLFQPFYRGKNAEGVEGTGLGLAIVKEYIELNEGRIEVDSQPESGTTFSIWLPKKLTN